MRKTLTSLLFSLPLLAAVAGSSQAMDKIAPAATITAKTSGQVRVIIMTRADSSIRDGGNAFRRPATYLSKQLGLPARQITPIGQLPMVSATVTTDALDRLREDPNVAYVFRDELRKPLLYDTVPSTGAEMHEKAGFTGKGWTVAVIDTGVDSSHPAFRRAIVGEACFSTTYSGQEGTSQSLCAGGRSEVIGKGAGVNCDMSYSENCFHGTHVAGIVAGRPVKLKNSKVVTGMAPEAKLLVAQVFSGFEGEAACGQGQHRCVLTWDSDVMRALEWVYSQRDKYRIASINMSLGSGEFREACDGQSPYEETIQRLRNAGIATVVASGNEGFQDAIAIPACLSSTISVSATTKQGALDERYSNVARFVTLAAPGTDIFSAIPGRRYIRASGTSMAAPHVAGAIAILRQENPGMSVSDIAKLLRKTGRTVSDSRTGTRLRRMDLGRIEIAGRDPLAAALQTPMSAEDASFEAQQQLIAYGESTMRTVIIQSPLGPEELKAKLGEACNAPDACTIEKIGETSYRVTVPFELVEQLTGTGTLEQKLEDALGGGVKVFQNRLNKPLVNNRLKDTEEAE